MPATPTHWHLSPNQLAITCDICQQTVSWAEWKRGHTLDHYRDGRWAERMQSWRPDELCQSSPGYQPPPLESGVRELIINTVGAQVPVDVDANTAPNTVCMNGVHGKTDRWWYVAAGPLTLADLHEAIASYVSAHGYAPKRMLVLPGDFQRLSADSCLACSVASNTLRMHAETMRGEPARVGRSDVSFEPKHDSCTIAGVKFVAVEKKPRPSIQVEHTPESGRGIATLDFTPSRPDNSVAHLDVDLLADDE